MTTSATAPLDAGRHDVIEGYILSKLRFADFGDLEETLNRKFAATMAAAGGDVSPEARREAIAVAAEVIRKRPYAWSKPDFDEAVFSWPLFPMLLWMSIKVRHPQVTPEEARKLTEAMDDSRKVVVRRALHELMGYKFDVEGTTEKESPPLDYRAIYHALRKKGLQPSEILNLNFDQVLCELDIYPDVEELKRERAAKTKAKQLEVMQKVATELGVAVGGLAALPLDRVVDAVGKVTGNPKVDPAVVQKSLADLNPST